VNFKFDPGFERHVLSGGHAGDGFSNPNPGFKFRRWDGDLTGTYLWEW